MDLLRSLPIGLYLEQPTTWLHRLDPRVKLAWLMSFLAVPILAGPVFRVVLVVLLTILTLSAMIPFRVWKQQLGWLLLLGFFAFVITAVTPDGMATTHQPRLPVDDLASSPALSSPANQVNQSSPANSSQVRSAPVPQLPQPTSYHYVLFKQGSVLVTRRSLDLAIRVSTLLFTLIYSTTLFLLTTAPEEITAGLEDVLQPLRRFKIPVTEIALTLTLSLRFIPLVLEEIQNLTRSVQTRAINWKKLGIKRSAQVWLIVVERLLENLLLRAEQIAGAMEVRGFTSPNRHQVPWHQLRLHQWDWLALGSLALLWGMRFAWGAV